MEVITLSDDLADAIKNEIKKGKYRDSDQFVREAIVEKLSIMTKFSAKEEVFRITGEVKARMKQKDIQENNILEEFDEFSKSLNQ